MPRARNEFKKKPKKRARATLAETGPADGNVSPTEPGLPAAAPLEPAAGRNTASEAPGNSGLTAAELEFFIAQNGAGESELEAGPAEEQSAHDPGYAEEYDADGPDDDPLLASLSAHSAPAGASGLIPDEAEQSHNHHPAPSTKIGRLPPIAKPQSKAPKRFLLERRLGIGGLCEVYVAKDLNRIEWGDSMPVVALKMLLPEFKDNRKAQQLLAREFFTLRHLAHPGVVRVYDLHKEPWGMCLSMELLESQNMKEKLHDNPSGLANARIIAEGLLSTLEYMHEQGVVHGDIKPANITCERDDRVVLFDFNTAEIEVKEGNASAAISRGLMADLNIPSFSPLQASPQRLSGEDASKGDDVFAACCTLYEIFSGEHPFQHLNSLEAIERKLKPKRPPRMDREQWKLIRAGLSFDEKSRPGAGELLVPFLPPPTTIKGWFGLE